MRFATMPKTSTSATVRNRDAASSSSPAALEERPPSGNIPGDEENAGPKVSPDPAATQDFKHASMPQSNRRISKATVAGWWIEHASRLLAQTGTPGDVLLITSPAGEAGDLDLSRFERILGRPVHLLQPFRPTDISPSCPRSIRHHGAGESLLENLKDLEDAHFAAALLEAEWLDGSEKAVLILLELSRLIAHGGTLVLPCRAVDDERAAGTPRGAASWIELLEDAGFSIRSYKDAASGIRFNKDAASGIRFNKDAASGIQELIDSPPGPSTTADGDATPEDEHPGPHPGCRLLVSSRVRVPDVSKLCRPARPRDRSFHEETALRLAAFPGVHVEKLSVDTEKFLSYDCIDPHSPPTTVHEKSLEYFLSEQLLGFERNDTFIDIASLSSPFPEHVRRHHGCTVYRQDLYHYEAGIHGERIGGDATRMPVPEAFCSKLSLHCSFEHFEGNSDTAFIREAARMVRDGGRLFIGPLYMAPYYRIEYEHSRVEAGKEQICLPGCRFTRTYDIERLCRRVLIPAREEFDITLFLVDNIVDLKTRLPAEANVYCHLCLVLTRRARHPEPPSGRSTRRPNTREAAVLLPRTLFGGAPQNLPEPSSDRATGSTTGAIRARKSARAVKRLLVIHERVPEDDSSGSDYRLLHILERLRHAGHEVTFIGRNGDRADRYRPNLERLGITVYPVDPERMAWLRDEPAPPIDLERLIAKGEFDAAILCTWFWLGLSATEQYLEAIRKVAPDLPLIVLSDDVHWYREALRAQVTGRRIDVEVSRCLRIKESEIYRAADLVLAITREDTERMHADQPDLRISLLRHSVGELPPIGPSFEERRTLLFLGSGVNEANERAVGRLVGSILPLIRARIPDVPLEIVGQPPPNGWPIPAGSKGINTTGQVQSLAPHFGAARVFVSPITYGTGLKTKNVLAMAHGVPLVTTRIGAEGMQLTDADTAYIQDQPEGFAAAVVRLCQDQEQWERMAARSRDHVQTHFGPQILDEDIGRLVEEIERLQPLLGVPFISSLQVEQRFSEACFAPQPGRLLKRANAHIELAREFIARGRLDHAAHELRMILCELRFTPDFPGLSPVYVSLAKVYFARGEPQEAEASLYEALRLRPDNTDARSLLVGRAGPA